MEYEGYLARIEFDDEANIFHGEVINIFDVVTFQGQSVEELRQAFEDSVEDYLVFCAERGDAADPPEAELDTRMVERIESLGSRPAADDVSDVEIVAEFDAVRREGLARRRGDAES